MLDDKQALVVLEAAFVFLFDDGHGDQVVLLFDGDDLC